MKDKDKRKKQESYRGNWEEISIELEWIHLDLYYIVHRRESKLTLGKELTMVGCLQRMLKLVGLSCVPVMMTLG
jgi:hypothetical protein